MDWQSERITSYRYMRVDRTTMRDVEELDMFLDGGTIEYNDLSQIKAGGALPYVWKPELNNDYIRVYAIHEQGTERLEALLGTFMTATASSLYNRQSRSGSVNLFSLLRIAQAVEIEEPLTVPAGTIALNYAMSMMLDLGLAVYADISSTKLTTNPTYDGGTTKLSIVNDLLSLIGFDSAEIDATGVVRMVEYTDPGNRTPSVVFRDDQPGCTFSPQVLHDLDESEVPNVFVARTSSNDVDLVARAVNNDPSSRFSTIKKGYEITRSEEVTDITTQQALDAYAKRRLTEMTSAVESIKIKHPEQPLEPGDGVRAIYTEADLDFTGVASDKLVKLTPAMVCDTTVRKFIRW